MSRTPIHTKSTSYVDGQNPCTELAVGMMSKTGGDASQRLTSLKLFYRKMRCGVSSLDYKETNVIYCKRGRKLDVIKEEKIVV